MRLLLLDDNLMSSDRLERRLAAEHQLTVATNLPDLAEFEAVILNLGSRTMPGLELLRELKSTRPDLPVVGFCGHLETDLRRAAKAAGIDRLATNSDTAERPLELVAGLAGG